MTESTKLPEDIPEVSLDADGDALWVCRLLSQSGLASSNGEAKRLIQQGGVKLDGQRVSDPAAEVPATGSVLVQVGKRRIARVVFQDG